ncbi:MAG: hypothetical protein ACI80V_003455 [Rhodothermales bacterium]|jgi:hypothetical protein
MNLRFSSLCFLFGALAACNPPADPPELPPAEDSDFAWVMDGYSPLFDGHSLNGWRGLGREDIPSGHWVVDGDAIHKVASGSIPRAADGQVLAGGDLITHATYTDFDLRFEWKVAPGANSGIKYNADETISVATAPATGALGFEYQVLDDSLHVDGALTTHRAGSLYDLLAAPDDKPINDPGSFNTGRIVWHGGHGQHWLNGTLVVEFDVASAEFTAAYKASKYSGFEGFVTPKEAPIVLQDHGDDVWFRHLQIKRLTP